MCFDFLYNFLSDKFLILRKIQLWYMYIGLRVRYPLFLADFNKPVVFSTFFTKNKYQKVKVRPTRCNK